MFTCTSTILFPYHCCCCCCCAGTDSGSVASTVLVVVITWFQSVVVGTVGNLVSKTLILRKRHRRHLIGWWGERRILQLARPGIPESLLLLTWLLAPHQAIPSDMPRSVVQMTVKIIWSWSATPIWASTVTSYHCTPLSTLEILNFFVVAQGSTRGVGFLPTLMVGQVVLFNTGCCCYKVIIVMEPQQKNWSPYHIL